MNKWISVKERLPQPEMEVLVLVEHRYVYGDGAHKIITTAMYEDGKQPVEESAWNWCDLDSYYDEESGQDLIPEGWWEYRHYNPDYVYNNAVDGTVTHWMPLPEPPREEKE